LPARRRRREDIAEVSPRHRIGTGLRRNSEPVARQVGATHADPFIDVPENPR